VFQPRLEPSKIAGAGQMLFFDLHMQLPLRLQEEYYGSD
jgi:hypothetical protein